MKFLPSLPTSKGPNQIKLIWPAVSNSGYGYLVKIQSLDDPCYLIWTELRPISTGITAGWKTSGTADKLFQSRAHQRWHHAYRQRHAGLISRKAAKPQRKPSVSRARAIRLVGLRRSLARLHTLFFDMTLIATRRASKLSHASSRASS